MSSLDCSRIVKPAYMGLQSVTLVFASSTIVRLSLMILNLLKVALETSFDAFFPLQTSCTLTRRRTFSKVFPVTYSLHRRDIIIEYYNRSCQSVGEKTIQHTHEHTFERLLCNANACARARACA